MISRTAEEAKNDSIAKMGKELGSIYSALWQEVAHLEGKWQQFLVLYGTNPERVDLLNDTAPYFFHLLQDILWENVVLHLARLTDPPTSLGKKDRANLSIQALPAFVTDQTFHGMVTTKVKVAIDATEFARDWRNRLLAHRDLSLAIDEHAKPLETATRDSARVALKAIEDVLNSVEAHYLSSETFYGAGGGGPGDAVCLLRALYDGRIAALEREARFERGEILEKDYPPKF
jgi:hypothetical protein